MVAEVVLLAAVGWGWGWLVATLLATRRHTDRQTDRQTDGGLGVVGLHMCTDVHGQVHAFCGSLKCISGQFCIR